MPPRSTRRFISRDSCIRPKLAIPFITGNNCESLSSSKRRFLFRPTDPTDANCGPFARSGRFMLVFVICSVGHLAVRRSGRGSKKSVPTCSHNFHHVCCFQRSGTSSMTFSFTKLQVCIAYVRAYLVSVSTMYKCVQVHLCA